MVEYKELAEIIVSGIILILVVYIKIRWGEKKFTRKSHKKQKQKDRLLKKEKFEPITMGTDEQKTILKKISRIIR